MKLPDFDGSIIEYLITVFKKFNNGTMYLFMFAYLAALVLIIVFIKREKIKTMLVIPQIIYVLLLINPVVFTFLATIRVVASGRFYRIFWVLPIALTIAYVITYFITKFKKKAVVALLVVAACLCLPLLGNIERVADLRTESDIEYKIPKFIVRTSNAIHEDFGEGQPVLYYDNYFLRNFRTYDAGVISYREKIDNELVDLDVAQYALENNQPYYVLHYVILLGNKDFVPAEELSKYTEGIDYIICEYDESNMDYYTRAGFEFIDDYYTYEIYRVK